ncbi:MAG: hypothetical protein AAFZ52_05110 [Bacteroidota bacterium]
MPTSRAEVILPNRRIWGLKCSYLSQKIQLLLADDHQILIEGRQLLHRTHQS